MKSKIVWGLIVLNAVLAAALVGRATRENTAMAQIRRPGEVMMIPGEIAGGTRSLVYMVDIEHRQLSAMVYDGNDLTFMAPIDLDRIMGGETAPRGGPMRR
jgi:hypothetical protein